MSEFKLRKKLIICALDHYSKRISKISMSETPETINEFLKKDISSNVKFINVAKELIENYPDSIYDKKHDAFRITCSAFDCYIYDLKQTVKNIEENFAEGKAKPILTNMKKEIRFAEHEQSLICDLKIDMSYSE